MVEIIQFVRPHGRRRSIKIELPEKQTVKMKALFKEGYQIECEVLSDNHTLSIEICKEDDAGDPIILASCLVGNGPQVPVRLCALIDEASTMLASMPGDSGE